MFGRVHRARARANRNLRRKTQNSAIHHNRSRVTREPHAAQPRNSGLVHLAMIYRTQSHAIYLTITLNTIYLTITLNTGSKDNTSRSQRKTRLYRSWRLGSLLEHLTTTATRESLMAVNILRLLSSSMHRPHGSSCIFPCILHASFMHLMSQHSPHPSKLVVGSSRSLSEEVAIWACPSSRPKRRKLSLASSSA